jgi:hypothetical protein
MVMPLCGTFDYAGIVPASKLARASGLWVLNDQSGAARIWQVWKFAHGYDPLHDRRLVGLRPRLRVAGTRLILKAPLWHRAQVRWASLELDRPSIDAWQSGDLLTLVRTGTADVGMSLIRRGQLIMAVGAATATPLANVVVKNGPVWDPAARIEDFRRSDRWVDVTISGETARLSKGGSVTIKNYRVSTVRCYEFGVPGSYESLAISLEGACSHEGTVRSAELLARPNAGLAMRRDR